MNQDKQITDLTEATTVPAESSYMVNMGDGTGTKQIKHKNLAAQLKREIAPEGPASVEEMTYEETIEFLNGSGSEEEALS